MMRPVPRRLMARPTVLRREVVAGEGDAVGKAGVVDQKVNRLGVVGEAGRHAVDVTSVRQVCGKGLEPRRSAVPSLRDPGGRRGLGPDGRRGVHRLIHHGRGTVLHKPGVLLTPADFALGARLAGSELPGPAPLLNERITGGYLHTPDRLAGHSAVTVLLAGDDARDDAPSPTVLRTTATALLPDLEDLFQECFGPTVLVAEYDAEDELVAVADAIDGQLTATLIAEPDDEVVPELVRRLVPKVGRLLWTRGRPGLGHPRPAARRALPGDDGVGDHLGRHGRDRTVPPTSRVPGFPRATVAGRTA
jgi:hypothetical protein